MAHKITEVTPKQGEVLRYIIKFTEQYGYQPSHTEIAEGIGVSRRAIFDRLRQLHDKGLIELPEDNQPRCIRLVGVKFKCILED
jgi:predicted transcriptional regulator